MTTPIFVSSPSTPTAVAIGRAAARALLHNTRGHVLAVFSCGCYLQAPDGSLAFVGLPALGRCPLNVIVDIPDWLERVRPGDEWRRRNTQIVIGGSTAFALPNVDPWRPPPAPGRPPPDVALVTLTKFASRQAPTSGLGPTVVPMLLGNAIATSAQPLLAVAAGPLNALRDWVSSDAWGKPPAEAVKLLGLGPGLTPAGDDALSGALLALQAFGEPVAARSLSDFLGAVAIAATSAISRAHLACAIDGEGHECLHALFTALASAEPDAIAFAADRVTAIGHSSGWDALAGVAAVLAGLSRRADQRQRQRRGVGI